MADLESSGRMNHLREQVCFLHTGNQGFDGGRTFEAKAMAVRLRVLFHSTTNSHALLDQLGLRMSLEMYDTAFPLNSTGTLGGESVLTLLRIGPGSSLSYVPKLDASPVPVYGTATVDDWWLRPIIVDDSGFSLTRESLCLVMANKDGGAHVDPKLDATYEQLRQNGLGIGAGKAATPSGYITPVFAAMRQCSHEVLVSLALNKPDAFSSDVPLSRYRDLPRASPEQIFGQAFYFGDLHIDWSNRDGSPATPLLNAGWPATIRRDQLCPCGSRKKFCNCHGC